MSAYEDLDTLYEASGETHYKMMVVVWLVAGNIGLWSQAFKQYKWANFVHMICMSVVTIITWMSGFLAIFVFGLDADIGSFHIGLGIAIMILLILQSAGGAICMLSQKSSKVSPQLVVIINYGHRIFGMILYLLTLIQLLAPTLQDQYDIFVAVIVISLISYVAYLLLRFFRRDMQGYTKINQLDTEDLATITNSRDLIKYNGQYFIFADRVYDINNVISNHPGGYDLIKNIKGRQVDRFLYGSEPLESVQKMRLHSHTSSSITLAGDPLAKLESLCPYQNMSESNQVQVRCLLTPCKSSVIYTPILNAIGDSPFAYKGYEDLSQLGKYYAVTINNNRTRLYSVVNFLHSTNIQLMERISGKNFLQNSAGMNKNVSNETETIVHHQIKLFNSDDEGVPLLIKKYHNGDFTSKFLEGSFLGKVSISKPRGRGLSLNEMMPGHIIFFAGGTGINPFCDLIDLLFKQSLIDNGNMNSQLIISRNPILDKISLNKKFKFSLYYSVHNADQIHDLTAYQLNQLSSIGRMKAYIRVNENSQNFFKKYPSISKIETRFDHVIAQLAEKIESISQIYLCGPLTLTKAVYNSLVQQNIPAEKYIVL